MSIWAIIGVCLVIGVGLRFIQRLGQAIPILELMLLIAGLQWIVGPLIEYNYPTNHYKYYMYVPELEYMVVIVPAYGLFVLGVLLGLKGKDLGHIPVAQLQRYKQYGVFIFLVGVGFDLISSRLPGALAFFGFIVANFKFAGAIILFFSEDPKLKKIFYFSLIYLFVRAVQAAMFHDLVLWSVFFYMFWALKFKPSKHQIYLTIVVGLLSVSTLQTIKAAYRAKVWQGFQGNKLELFTSLFIEALFFEESESTGEELSGEENNVRLNQGWIISAIIDEIPQRVEFQNGLSITEAVMASIFPRFLNPNKKKAGGKENFEKFTGLSLGENTSMGISIVGEAYGNFGRWGVMLFMGLWGWFLALYWRFLMKKISNKIILLAFLPIIFLQVVKAETELVVVLNHLVKASIVVFLFLWGAKNVLKWKLSDG